MRYYECFSEINNCNTDDFYWGHVGYLFTGRFCIFVRSYFEVLLVQE